VKRRIILTLLAVPSLTILLLGGFYFTQQYGTVYGKIDLPQTAFRLSVESAESDEWLETGITEDNIQEVRIERETPEINEGRLAVTLDGKGRDQLEKVSEESIGRQIALILDNKIRAQLVITGKVSGGTVFIPLTNTTDSEAFWIKARIQGYYYKIPFKDYPVEEVGVSVDDTIPSLVLPSAEGEKLASFEWKYKGKKYSLERTLYGSYYKYYSELPTDHDPNSEVSAEWYEKNNTMFMDGVAGDVTLKELADSLKKMADEKKFNDNQIVEFVASFVQTIPYDQVKLDNRTQGLNGFTEKITYPYEVLYDNKGVCQDKSYLAYKLLKELGYGVAIFEFPDPEDNHMAIGVKCPIEYSNYESGFCFLESTSLGNKIGTIPELIPQTRIATSDIQITDIESGSEAEEYVPLGNVEIRNISEGKEYTGIINTIATQREIESLRKAVLSHKAKIRQLGVSVKKYESDLKKYEKKLKKEDDYDDYNDLYDDYDDLYSKYKRTLKEYNAEVKAGNGVVDRYNSLNYQFYL